jgi:hypothetical protein
MVKLRGGVDKLSGILKQMVLRYGCSLFCPILNVLFNFAVTGLLN